jgi:predicted permease
MFRIAYDLRFACRSLRRTPSFAAAAVLSLALGIGANTAMFTITDKALFRPLPVRHAAELVYFESNGSERAMVAGPDAFSHPMYQDLRDRNRTLAGLAGRFAVPVSLSWQKHSERVTGELVTGNYFDVLGLETVLGRPFTPADDRIPGAHNAVVLTDRCWRARFAGDPKILNETVVVNGHPMTVIGVAAAGYEGYSTLEQPVDLLVPSVMKAQITPTWDGLRDRRVLWLQLIGRLRAGVSRVQAQAELRGLYRAVRASELESMPNVTGQFRTTFLNKPLTLLPGGHHDEFDMAPEGAAAVVTLDCLVGLLLLIACANVASLLLARAASRQKEIAIRLSLGAGRFRLVQQLLAESLVLAVAGGGLGVLFALWTGSWLTRLVPELPARLLDTTPDFRMLAIAAVLSALTGLVFGLVPALQSTRPALAPVLQREAGSLTAGVGHVRLRKGMVVAQVALSMLLLVSASMLTRSLGKLRACDLGFRRDHVLLFTVYPELNGYTGERAHRFAADLQQRVAAVPGVRSASLGENLLLDDNDNRSPIFIVGEKPGQRRETSADFDAVAPGYFATLGQPLLLGREFTSRDGATAPRVAVVNEAFARYYFGGENPLGRRFGHQRDATHPYEIVGVVRTAKFGTVRDRDRRVVYRSYQQTHHAEAMTLYAVTAGDPASVSGAIRREVVRLDAAIPIYGMKTMEAQIDASLSGERAVAALAAAFGLLATVLASVGLYGVMAYTVARRTRELGLRVALGAGRRDLIGMVVREAGALAALGVALALPLALGLGLLVRSQLYGIGPIDAVSLGAAIAVLGLVAVAAGFFPARRAARIDPMQALRYE